MRQDPRLEKIVAIGARWEMRESEPAWEMISSMTGDIWKTMFPESHESYMRLNPEPDYDRFAASVVAMWTDLSSSGHPEQLVCQITNEMLVVRGDNDPLTSLESMAKLRRHNRKVNFLNIPFADHVAFNNAPVVFLRAVNGFFDVDFQK